MKKIKSALVLLFPILLHAQGGFKVTATFKNLGSNKVRAMYYNKDGKYKQDTLTAVNKDEVIWEGQLNEPQIVRMEVMDTTLALRIGKAASNQPPLMFLLTNSNVTVNGDAKEAFSSTITTKDPEMLAYEEYRVFDRKNTKDTWELQKEHNRKLNAQDTVGNGEIMAKMGALRKLNQRTRMEFIDKHPKSFASIIMLGNLSLVMTNEEMFKKYESLDPQHKESKTAKAVYAKMESNRRTAVGKPLSDFSLTGIDGKQVNTADLKGKVILIDFWGSWCVPCRKSHPGLKELYAKYKSKGLEIIGVANEGISGNKTPAQQIESWKKAVKEDDINWLHVLTDPAVKDLAKEYDISGYPTKFLVGRDGKFLMRILGSSEAMHKALEQKLAELMPE